MPRIQVPYISGQYSGFQNDLLLTPDKHKAVYNADMNDLGVWRTRPGNTLVQDLGNGDVLGIHDATFASGTHTHIATVGTVLKNVQTGATIGAKTFTTGRKTQYENFINKVFIVNGVDAMSDWDGVTTFDSANITGAPVANYIQRYGARLYTDDTTNRRRVNYSSQPVASAITWAASTQFFEVESAGDFVSGLHAARNTLMVFTNEDIEIRYTSFARLGILKQKGTLSHRSIITSPNSTTFWHHPDIQRGFAGIFAYDGGGDDTATLISTPVQDIFDALTGSGAASVVAWIEGSTIVWYLGETVEMPYGQVNCVAFNVKNQGWASWYQPYTIKAAGSFFNSSTNVREAYIGVTDAVVYKRTKDTGDAGAAIESFIESHPLKGEDPFGYNQYTTVALKGQQFGSTRCLYRSDTDTQRNEAPFVPSYQSNDVWTAKIQALGSGLTVRIALSDTVKQQLSGYHVYYTVAGAPD